MVNRHEVVIPQSLEDGEYVVLDGQFVKKEEWNEKEFADLLIMGHSVTHVRIMSLDEIMKTYGDILSPEEIENLKKTISDKE